MFGLAIWDARQRRLVLARDPFGIKLVYYRIDGDRLYFRLGDSRCPCGDAGQGRDRSHFVESLPSLSLYALALHDIQGRAETAPGTKLIVRKWRLPAESVVPIQAHCHLRRQSRPAKPGKNCWRSTNRRSGGNCISDVPVGLLLSGGVDSGLLLALMNLNGRFLADLYRRIRLKLRRR